jgi:hypothetical protein
MLNAVVVTAILTQGVFICKKLFALLKVGVDNRAICRKINGASKIKRLDADRNGADY